MSESWHRLLDLEVDRHKEDMEYLANLVMQLSSKIVHIMTIGREHRETQPKT